MTSSRSAEPALFDLFLLLSSVLLVASGTLAVGVFLYHQYLGTSLQSKTEQIERAKKAFEPALVQDLARLDDRMHASDSILGAHLAISGFFRMLEAATLKSVTFKTLTFDASDPKDIQIKMTGTARTVNGIALQADVFTKGGALVSPIFSNIVRQDDGVNFELSAEVNQSLVRFSSVKGAAGESTLQSGDVFAPQNVSVPQEAQPPAPAPTSTSVKSNEPASAPPQPQPRL